MVTFLIFLSTIFTISNCEKFSYVFYPEETTDVFPGDIKRFVLNTNHTYKFSVQFSETGEEKLEGFLFQAHSQRHTITLSTSEELVYGNYVKGTNVGLWKSLSSTETTFHYYIEIASYEDTAFIESENVTVMIAVPTISIDSPIPGGCTLTSSLETDPNIRLNYTSYTTTVTYEDGNVGYDPHNELPKDCSTKSMDQPYFQWVDYTVYHKVLNIGDYSEEHMFDAIEQMLTASSISDKKDSLSSFSVDSTGVKSTVIDSYEGDGVVYNVVAEVAGYPSTAYVPAVTYSCDFVPGSSGCRKYIDTVHIVVGIVIALVGLFLLYGAHRLFHVEVYVFHSLIFMFLGYVAIGNVSLNPSGGLSVLEMRLLIALACALVLGGVMFLGWFFSGWYLPSVLLFTSTTGFLLMSSLMFALSFTAVDSISFMKVNYVYFLLFACVIVLVLIPAVIFPKAMNILSSSIIGSYLLIFCVGLFSYTSLMEILLRVVKNATLSGYMKTEASYIFGIKDIILSIVWAVLLVTGIVIQSLLAYKRESQFPQPSLYKKMQKRFKRREPVIYGVANERSKLLNSYYNS